jgi:hypothetical protein
MTTTAGNEMRMHEQHETTGGLADRCSQGMRDERGGLVRPALFSGPPSLAASGPERSTRRDWSWYGADTTSQWPAQTGRAPVRITPRPAGPRLGCEVAV